MTTTRGPGERQEHDDLEHRADEIRHAKDFESMRGLLGELPPGIFPPKSEFGPRRRDR